MSCLKLNELAIGEPPLADRNTPHVLLGPTRIIDSQIVNERIADEIVQHLRFRFTTFAGLPGVQLF